MQSIVSSAPQMHVATSRWFARVHRLMSLLILIFDVDGELKKNKKQVPLRAK
jgi:hypothetical protein